MLNVVRWTKDKEVSNRGRTFFTLGELSMEFHDNLFNLIIILFCDDN